MLNLKTAPTARARIVDANTSHNIFMNNQPAICLAMSIFLFGSFSRAQTSGPSSTSEPIVAESALLRVVEQVETPARAAGVLARIDVQEGDVVDVGATLAQVDDEEAKLVYQRSVVEHELAKHRAENDAAIRSAKKALAYARREAQRFQKAARELPGSISKSELEESEMQAEQRDLDVIQAKHDHRTDALAEQLKRTERVLALHKQKMHEIVAPVGGMVVEILRRRGEWVEPGDNVLRIMRIDRLRAEGLVAVEHAMRGLHGAPAEITVEAPGQPPVTVTGRIVFVNPEINPVNGRLRVRAEFENPQGRLMPGMRAAMKIYPHATSDRDSALETAADATSGVNPRAEQ